MGPDKREEMFGHMNSLSNAMVCGDVATLFEHAAKDPAADDGPAACIIIVSGPFAFAAAAAFSDRTGQCLTAWRAPV